MKITIPKPCTENWQKMEKREQCRYCSTCEKSVIDFTDFSDKELIAYFNTNPIDNKVCGHFNQYQLNTILITNNLHNRTRLGIFSTLMLISTISFNNNIKGHLKYPLTLIQDKKTLSDNENLGDNIQKEGQEVRHIKGKVYDSETKEQLQYVSISIKDTKVDTLTDEKGEFDLLIPSEYNKSETVIIVSFTGYFTEERKLSSITKERWDIGLATVTLTGEVVIINKPTTLWNKFTNIFKKKQKQPKCD